ncbi:MAG: signal recognition particle protein, partial [Alphaproteobacteria bacterium]|nr:signal recognition particle protein [Alphaproteobacteria bacterium]
VSLVERAAETIEKDEAEKLARKMSKGEFDLDDMASQLRQLRKMGGMGGVMGMLPGMGKMQKQMAGANLDDRMLVRQEAIITSMTKKERKDIKLLNGSRRKRIAAGSGTSVQDVNRLLKQYQDMSRMMKMMGKKGMLKGLMGAMGGGGGGMPQMPPGGLGGLGGGMGSGGPGLPGLPKLPGGKLPPGFGRR